MEAKEIAEKLKVHNRKVLMLPNAQVPFEIRRLQPWDFLSMPGIPTGSVVGDGTATHKVDRDYAKEKRTAEGIVRLAAVKPRICAEGMEPGEDEISVQDLGDDLGYVLDEIVAFAKLGPEAQVVEKFRKGESETPGDS